MATILEEKEEVNESEREVSKLNSQNSNNKRKNRKIITIICVVLVIILTIIFCVLNNVKEKERVAQEEQLRIQQEQQEQKDNEFKYNMAVAANKMLVNATMGSKYVYAYIDLCNKYSALGNDYVKNTILSTDRSREIVDSMKENDSIVVDNMKWLAENKSEKYSNVYEVLLEMYENYKVHYIYSVDLSVYSSNLSDFKEKSNLILQKAEKMIVMQPDIENIIDGKEK